MTVEYALRLFGLTPANNSEEITERYRLLVREYHPDKNTSKKEIAHIMMIKINEAYDVIRKHKFPSSSVESELDVAEAQQMTREKREEERFDISEGELSEEELVRGAVAEQPLQLHLYWKSAITEGIDIVRYYYQFGLHNVQMRQVGSGRLHYSGLCKRLLRFLQTIQHTPHIYRKKGDNINYFEELLHLFYENITINLFMQPSGNKLLYKEFLNYRAGCQAADGAFLAWYCYEMVGGRLPYFDMHNYEVAYTVFSALSESDLSEEIQQASEIKMLLLEQFACTRYFEFVRS